MSSNKSSSNLSVTELFCGYLFKRGKVNIHYRKRWFVLYSDYRLCYYQTKQKTKLNGIIHISAVSGIGMNSSNIPNSSKTQTNSNSSNFRRKYRRKKKSNKLMNIGGVGYEFKLHTPTRIWCFKCETYDECRLWISYIRKMRFGEILHDSYIYWLTPTMNTRVWKRKYCFLCSDEYTLRYIHVLLFMFVLFFHLPQNI